ncbi:putative transcription factor [Quercus suber]|uniref:Transcription factor n=1 Tax=Quercus suber TaxID=58331 RepID=A0AAW0KZ17_QUESU
MAPKRPSHLDDPPAASSSEEEEEETSSEDEEDEEEEEGESSSEEEEHKAEAAKIDSLPSTPATKPRSKPSSARSSATTKKRPNGEAEATPSKRVKKKDPEPKSQDVVVSPSEDSKKGGGGGDEKKLFQRLWSDENEIELLKGMLDYTALRGADPAADAAAFFEFVKKSLHVEVTKAQLVDKMKRLRKKYNNNAGRGKKGKDPTFSKPHEQKTYELSKKIWGSVEAATETEKAKDINNGKAKAKDNKNGKAKAKDNNNNNKNQKGNSLIRSLKEELTESSPVLYKYGEKMEIDGDSGSGSCLNGMLRFHKNVWLDERVIKRGLELIDEEKKVELEERWKEVELAELEVYVKQTELIKDQARLILEAYKDH